MSCLASLLGFVVPASGYRGILWPSGPQHKMKGILCMTGSYMEKGDLGRGLQTLRPLRAAPRETGESVGWNNTSWSPLWFLGRTDGFPIPHAGADCPKPPHCSASALQGAGFWGGDSDQHLLKGGIHSLHFVGICPYLNTSCLGPNCCILFGYRFAMNHNVLSIFPKQNWREKEDDPFRFL